MTKLTEILKRLGCQECVRRNRIDEPEAEQAILAWVDEVIGEDDKHTTWGEALNNIQKFPHEFRNDLRTEQRKRAGL